MFCWYGWFNNSEFEGQNIGSNKFMKRTRFVDYKIRDKNMLVIARLRLLLRLTYTLKPHWIL